MLKYLWLGLLFILPQANVSITPFIGAPVSLAVALSACSNCTIIIGSTVMAAVNTTIPSTTTLQFNQGGSLSVNTGVTVNFQGAAIVAGLYQVFSGPGNVTNLTPVEPEWFGPIGTATTLPLAVAALASANCKLVFQGGGSRYNVASYSDSSPLSLSNCELAGGGMPFPNSNTTPTSLVGGTIMYPSFALSGSFLNVHDLGVDNGSATTATAADALNFVCTTGSTAACGTNLTLNNLSCLGNSTTAAFHCFKVEGYDSVTGNNLWGWRSMDGFVAKTTNSTFSNIYEKGHLLACAYLKSENYAPSKNTVLTNVSCQPEVAGDTDYPLIVQGATAPLVADVVSNLTATGMLFGVNFSGGTTAPNAIQNFVLNGAALNSSTGFGLYWSGFISGVLVHGVSLTNYAGWTSIASASDPNISNVVISEVLADAASGQGCINLPGNASVYDSPSLTNSACPTVVFPSPSSQWTAALNSAVPLTSGTTIPQFQFTAASPIKIVAIDVSATTPATCSAEPVLYVYDITANARANGTQVIFVNGTTAYHNSGSPVVVPAGHVVALEAQANATCATAPVINAIVQYQPQ
jgi:hypothetical protein